MAEIRTTRMRLVQWTEGTDSPQRVDFNETFLNIETLAAIDQQGVYDSRPTPNKTGMYYFATDQGILYRSDGLAWAVVGSSTLSHLVRAARTDSVSFTIQAIASQTSDLQRITTTSGATLVRVRSNGDLLVGPMRVSQAARTTVAADTAPTDSAMTLDNNSSTMWNTTAKNTTGNTAGFFRAVRGTSTVFSVGPDGTVSTPAVNLTSEPTSDSHAVRRLDLNTAVANRTYALTSDQLTGQLPVSKGGTGGTTEATARSGIGAAASATTIATGDGLIGGGDLSANRTFSITFANGTAWAADQGTSNLVARYDHEHDLSQVKIKGILPASKGGTGRTVATAGAYLRGNAAGDAYEGVTPANLRADIDAATSGHGHALTDANITGILPVSQGGTNSTTVAAARSTLGVPWEGQTINTGAGLSGGGNLTANRTLSVVFPTSDSGTWGGKAGTADVAARYDHSHDLANEKIVGVLPVLQGGTGATTVAAARTALAVPSTSVAINTGAGLSGGGTLAASRTLQVVFEGTGSATTVARSDHQHQFSEIQGLLNHSQIAKATPLGTAEDLDTFVNDGIFHQAANAGATGGSNYPIPRAGLFVVRAQSSMVYQLYWDYASTGAISYRTKYSSNWYPWKTVATTADIAALSSVYAPLAHGHSLTDANITGVLPVAQGGTGGTSTVAARNGIEAAYSGRQISTGAGLSGGGNLTADRTLSVVFPSPSFTHDGGVSTGSADIAARYDHRHNLAGTLLEGTLPVSKGGTGLTATTHGSFLRGSINGGYAFRTPEETRQEIGALGSSDQSFAVNAGSASGWDIYSGGVSVTPLRSGGKYACTMEVTMVRTDPPFTQGSSFIIHGYFVPAAYRPSHVSGQYVHCMVATATGVGHIRWSDGAFSARTDAAGVTQTINVGTRITFNLNWIVT